MYLTKLPFSVYRLALIGIACLSLIASIVSWAFFGLHMSHNDFGTIGNIDYAPTESTAPCARVLLAVLDKSPLADAGAQVGDKFCFDSEVQRGMDLIAGDHVGLQLIHAGRATHVNLIATAYPLRARRVVYALANPFVSVVTTMIGLVVGLRARQRNDLRSLGLGLVLIGMVEPTSMPYTAALAFTFVYPLSALGPLLILDFVMQFPGQGVGPWRRRLAVPPIVGAVASIAMMVIFWANRFTHWSGSIINVVEGCYALVLSLLIGLGVVIGRIEATGGMRARFNWLLPAVLSLGVASFFTLGPILPEQLDGWVTFGVYLMALVFPLGLAYATLRHRVLDFGFAVNRALVYTITSSLLLIGFSLTEFAVDKLLHFHGREGNIIIDAAVALGVILTFHRIQHWVGHRVDHVFYHDWQEAAGQLQRFVESSAQITQSSTLMTRFVAAIDQFIQPGATAIYLRNEQGAYHLAQSSLANAPAIIDVNDEAIIELRHQRKVITVDDGAVAGLAVLAVPMSVHGLLDGFLLLAGKHHGAAFRSDELRTLVAAAHRLMVNLEFLRVAKLDRENESLKEQVREFQQAENLAKIALHAAEQARAIAELRLKG